MSEKGKVFDIMQMKKDDMVTNHCKWEILEKVGLTTLCFLLVSYVHDEF